MKEDQVVKSFCGACLEGCGLLVNLKDGKVVRIEGDPDNPVGRGTLCQQGKAMLELLYHPDRLQYPMKRAGKKGEGKWQRISWDEAIDMMAKAFAAAKKEYGPESVALFRGAAKGNRDIYLDRFANAFGTPNVGNCGYLCFIPASIAHTLTLGQLYGGDLEGGSRCIIVWGKNSRATAEADYLTILRAMKSGAKLISIDVKKRDWGGAEPDMFIQPRPGTDLALALSMINVIISESLFDKDFVEKWTIGFDKLAAHAQDYSPDKVERITWVPAEKIREVARLYATNKPAIIDQGNALNHNINCLQTSRALSILIALTGNIDIPGGQVARGGYAPMVNRSSPEWTLSDKISKEQRAKRVSMQDKLMPMYWWVTLHSLFRAILEGDPYHIRALYLQGANPVLTEANGYKVTDALKKVDFLAVSDFFMTPTADLADMVLPAATFFEFDSIFINLPYKHVTQAQNKVTEIGECWSDWKILNELAKKLDMMDFYWDTEEEMLNELVKPSGMTFEEFRKVGPLFAKQEVKLYEKEGFSTPSGKAELYSARLEEWGYDPLPVYREPPETPYSDPELAKEYPVILTSQKMGEFIHSQGRQIKSLRDSRPDPLTEIHPETASRLGIKDGDEIYIENKRGRIKQKAKVTDTVAPGVVLVDYGWWFPEKGPSSWAEANVSILADDNVWAPEIGAPPLRFFCCKVYKAT